MKKWISLILIALMLCTFVGMAAAEVPNTDANTRSERYALGIKMGEHALWEWGEDYLLCQVVWNSLLLDDESAARFPHLAMTLEQMNLNKTLAMQDEMTWMLPIAKDVAGENMYCTSESEYYVQRSDEVILSVRENVYAFSGGAHPNTGTFGINFDCESGEELQLSDIMTDTDRALEIISNGLKERYALDEFIDVDEALGILTEDEFEWTMNEQGITFYFYPGLIAPYAAGQMTVTIWYDEYADLFNEKYLPAYGGVGAYASKISMFEPITLDFVNDDGKRDELIISAVTDEEGYMYEHYFIMLNDEVLDVTERYSYYIVPYLLTVNHGEERDYYLYIEETSDNDYRTLSIFELTEDGAKFKTEMPGSGFAFEWDMEREAAYSNVFNNPVDFRLAERLDILGTMTGVRSYSLDESSGCPIVQENYYDVSIGQMQVISAVALEVTMLDSNEKATIPAGTTFTFLRTDGDSYMDARLDDGSECRIDVRRDDEMTHWIGDLPEWECFEELFYAG